MVRIGDRSFLEMTVPTFLPATALPPPDYRPLAEAALSLHTLARNDPQPLGPASRAVCGETSSAYTPRSEKVQSVEPLRAALSQDLNGCQVDPYVAIWVEQQASHHNLVPISQRTRRVSRLPGGEFSPRGPPQEPFDRDELYRA